MGTSADTAPFIPHTSDTSAPVIWRLESTPGTSSTWTVTVTSWPIPGYGGVGPTGSVKTTLAAGGERTILPIKPFAEDADVLESKKRPYTGVVMPTGILNVAGADDTADVVTLVNVVQLLLSAEI